MSAKRPDPGDRWTALAATAKVHGLILVTRNDAHDRTRRAGSEPFKPARATPRYERAELFLCSSRYEVVARRSLIAHPFDTSRTRERDETGRGMAMQFGDPARGGFRYADNPISRERFLLEAESEEIVITRNGKPAGVLIGFGSEEDWFDYKLENDPRFLRRIEEARRSLHEGRGIWVKDVE